MTTLHKHNRPTLQTALQLMRKVDITAKSGAARLHQPATAKDNTSSLQLSATISSTVTLLDALL